MADDWALPRNSGKLNIPYQTFAFSETVPSAPITMGITSTFGALQILLSAKAIS